jgi:hypothetical protein
MRPATLLALLAPDLISIGGISRLSLVLPANTPKIVHGVHVQVMLLVRIATLLGKSRFQQAMISTSSALQDGNYCQSNNATNTHTQTLQACYGVSTHSESRRDVRVRQDVAT